MATLPYGLALTEPAGSTCLADTRISFQEAQFEEFLSGENLGMDFFFDIHLEVMFRLFSRWSSGKLLKCSMCGIFTYTFGSNLGRSSAPMEDMG